MSCFDNINEFKRLHNMDMELSTMVAQILQILTSRIQFNLEMYSKKILMHPQLNILNSSSRRFFSQQYFSGAKNSYVSIMPHER